jgi:hypothetical protein
MNKWSSVAVSAALVVAGVGASVSAEAHPYLTVGVDVPAVAVVFGHAPVYCGPYCYEHGRYWRRDYDRYRFDRFPRERWYRR